MASSARIEELKKKFDENPRRYFAPLANEYRKAGDIDQAIAICQEYLPQQPGHMSGHIVYGQALYEAGRLDEGKAVFETALSLDPENLIALRHLGDIARTQGDAGGARQWYQRVLDADPRNEEIQSLLAGLGTGGAADTDAPTSDEAPGETAVPLTFSDVPTIEVPRMSVPPADAPAPPSAESSSAATVEVPRIRMPATRDAAADASSTAPTVEVPAMRVEIETPVSESPLESTPPESQLADLETTIQDATRAPGRISVGLSGLEIESVGGAGLDEAPSAGGLHGLEPTSFGGGAHADDAPTVHEMVQEEVLIDLASDATGEMPASMEAASNTDELPLLDVAADELPPARPTAPPAREPLVYEEPAAPEEPVAAPVAPAAGAEPPAEVPARVDHSAETPHVPAPAIVTETMAELYLRQGHRDQAIAVYRQLAERRPADQAIRERLAELERPAASNGAGRSGQSIRDFLSGLALRPAPTGARPSEMLAAPVLDEDAPAEAPPDAFQEPIAAEPAEPVEAAPPVMSGAAPSSSAPSPHATTSGTIDALFAGSGARADDEAAERLAGAFTAFFPGGGPTGVTTAPEEPAAPQDAAAATAPGEEAAPEPAMAGKPARPAAAELSLDQVFKNTPAAGTGFSFDQFFSRSALQQPGTPPTDQPPVGAAHEEDDIRQFNSWLEGLKKS